MTAVGPPHQGSGTMCRNRAEAMVRRLEICWHAPVDFSVLLDATAKRHPLQIALERVAPLVVGADKVLLVAMALAAELHAAVGAHVLDHLDAARVADHVDRAFSHCRALEVAHVRNLGLQPDIVPVLPVEEALQLFLVQVFTGVGHERDSAAAFGFPSHLAGKDFLGGCAHCCLLGCFVGLTCQWHKTHPRTPALATRPFAVPARQWPRPSAAHRRGRRESLPGCASPGRWRR